MYSKRFVGSNQKEEQRSAAVKWDYGVSDMDFSSRQVRCNLGKRSQFLWLIHTSNVELVALAELSKAFEHI